MHQVMQRNGLIHSPQLMKPIRPQRPNAKPQINFRERAEGDGQGKEDCNGLVVDNGVGVFLKV